MKDKRNIWGILSALGLLILLGLAALVIYEESGNFPDPKAEPIQAEKEELLEQLED